MQSFQSYIRCLSNRLASPGAPSAASSLRSHGNLGTLSLCPPIAGSRPPHSGSPISGSRSAAISPWLAERHSMEPLHSARSISLTPHARSLPGIHRPLRRLHPPRTHPPHQTIQVDPQPSTDGSGRMQHNRRWHARCPARRVRCAPWPLRLRWRRQCGRGGRDRARRGGGYRRGRRCQWRWGRRFCRCPHCFTAC